jgi:Undecaprenyl-phosphate galactose phosphotransferase WbaP
MGIQLESSLLLPLPRVVKRAIDLFVAVIGGGVCLPLIGLIAALIKISSRGPVFYRQERMGYGNRRFHIVKFRTMIVDADKLLSQYLSSDPHLREEWERDSKIKNDPRITRVGRWLRRTSLDELPQIWNVIKGEMSLVGPRPIEDTDVLKYNGDFGLYAKVRPGITGLWQISGRSNTTFDHRVRLDAYYVRNWSPWFDLYVLARTFKVVLQQQGAC